MRPEQFRGATSPGAHRATTLLARSAPQPREFIDAFVSGEPFRAPPVVALAQQGIVFVPRSDL